MKYCCSSGCAHPGLAVRAKQGFQEDEGDAGSKVTDVRRTGRVGSFPGSPVSSASWRRFTLCILGGVWKQTFSSAGKATSSVFLL